MPGFLSRIFRRKNASASSDDPKDSLVTKSGNSRGSAAAASQSSSKNDRRNGGRRNNKTSPTRGIDATAKSSTLSTRNTDRSSPTTSEDVLATNPSTNASSSNMGSFRNGGAPAASTTTAPTTVASLGPTKFAPPTTLSPTGSWGAGPDRSDGDQRVVLGARNYQAPQPRRSGPVDLDDSEIDTDADENMVRRTSPRLSSERLMQLEKQQPQQPKFTMSDNFPRPLYTANQNPDTMSEGDESSSFNLSTDAEDLAAVSSPLELYRGGS